MPATGLTHDDRLARAARPDAEALRLHALCRGKMQNARDSAAALARAGLIPDPGAR